MRSKLASSIAILLNYGAKWRALYYIFYVLCLDLELSIVLNGQQLFSDITATETRGSITPLEFKASRSFFQYLMSAANLSQLNYSTAGAFGLFGVYLLLAGLACLVVMFHWPSSKILRSSYGRSFVFVFMIGSSFFLVFTISQFARLFVCEDVTVDVGDSSSILNATSEAYLPEFFMSQNMGKKSSIVKMSDLANDLACYSANHIVLGAVMSACIVFTIGLQVAYAGLAGHMYTSRLVAERFHSEYAPIFIYCLLPIIKAVAFLSKGTHISSNEYLMYGLACAGIDYLYHILVTPYYEQHFNTIRKLRSAMLVFASVSVQVERHLIARQRSGSSQTGEERSNFLMYVCELLAAMLVVKLTVKLSTQLDWQFALGRNQESDLRRKIETLVTDCIWYLEHFDKAKHPERLKQSMAVRLYDHLLAFKSSHPDQRESIEAISLMLLNFEQIGCFGEKLADKLELEQSWQLLCFPAKRTLLEHVEDSVDREFKPVIHLMESLIALYFHRDHMTFLKASPMMMAALIHMDLIYSVRPVMAAKLLKQALSFGRKRNLHMMVLESTVRLRTQDGIATSNYLMPEQRHCMHFISSQQNKLNLPKLICFMELFQNLKQTVNRMIQIKIETARSAAMGNLDIGPLFNSSIGFEDSKATCEKLFQSMQTIIGEDLSTAVSMVEAYYRAHLTFQMKDSLIILHGLANKHFTYGLKQMMEIEYVNKGKVARYSADKASVIVASAEMKNFHQIILVTSNIKEYTGFGAPQLHQSDLSTIIPEPFKHKHKYMSSPERSTGVVLDVKEDYGIFICVASGGIIPIGLIIRITTGLNSGLSMVGRINFDFSSGAKPLVVMTEDLRIAELTASAAEHFECNTKMSDYGEEIEEIAATFVRACQFKSIVQLATVAKDMLTGKPKDLEDIVSYEKIKKGLEVNFVDKRLKNSRLKLSIQELYLYALEECVYLVSFSVLKLDSSALVAKKKLLTRNKQVSGSTDLSSETSRIYPEYRPTEENAVELAVAHLEYIIKKRVMARMNLMLRRSPTSKQAAPQYHQSKTQKRRVVRQAVDSDDIRKPVKEQSLADVSSTHTMRLTNMGKSLSAKLGFQQLYNMLLIGSVVICLIFVAELIFSHITYSRGIRKYRDIALNAKSMDTASWAVLSVNCFQTIVDFTRLALDGAIKKDYLHDQGIPDFLEFQTQQKLPMQNIHLLYTMNAMLDIYNLKTYNPEQKSPGLVSLKVPTSFNSSELKVEDFDEFTAVNQMQLILNRYIKRNDSEEGNSTRELEELIRYNLLNSMQSFAMELSAQTDEILLNMAGGILTANLRVCLVASAYIAVMLLYALLAFLLTRRQSMTTLKLVVNFKSKDVTDSIHVLERQSNNFQSMAEDEYSSYPNLSKYLVQDRYQSIDDAGFNTSTTESTLLDSKKRNILNKKTQKIQGENYRRSTLSSNTYFFGAGWKLFGMAFAMCLWACIRWASMIRDINHAVVIKNYITLYHLIVQTWNFHNSMEATLLAEITLGPSYQVQFRPIAQHLEYLLQQYKDVYIRRLEEMKSADLGFFTLTYRYLTSDYSLCTSLIQSNAVVYGHCGTEDLAEFDDNLLVVLKKSAALFSRIHRLVLDAGEDDEKRHALLYNSDLRSYIYYSFVMEVWDHGLVGQLYFSIMVNMAPNLDDLIKERLKGSSENGLIYVNAPATALLLVILIFFGFKWLNRIPLVCSSTAFLFEVSLLETNAWLSNKFKVLTR